MYFILAFKVLFSASLLWERQSSANNEISQDFFFFNFSAFLDILGWTCAHMWEATSAQLCVRVVGLRWVTQALFDVFCCETSCTTVGILSCGSSNIASHPLFPWGQHREMNDRCHFFKNKSQEYPYDLHWTPYKHERWTTFSRKLLTFSTHVSEEVLCRDKLIFYFYVLKSWVWLRRV